MAALTRSAWGGMGIEQSGVGRGGLDWAKRDWAELNWAGVGWSWRGVWCVLNGARWDGTWWGEAVKCSVARCGMLACRGVVRNACGVRFSTMDEMHGWMECGEY